MKIPDDYKGNVQKVVLELDYRCVIKINSDLGCWFSGLDRNNMILTESDVRDVIIAPSILISDNNKVNKTKNTDEKAI